MNADLQSVLHQFLPGYRQEHTLTPRQAEVCNHLKVCRTEALGGVQLHCDHCAYEQPWYCACRDRHCPKCQWCATQDWSDQQGRNVLPVTYYHLVFTLPHALNGWVARYPEVIYRLLFQAVWATLKTFGQNHLQGQLGATMVLHTWGQQLTRHVHLHCLIPGGAIDPDGQWHAARSTYLFPDRALSRKLRGNLVSRLRQAYQDEQMPALQSDEVNRLLEQLMQKDWVVYTNPWLKQPQTVINYLARYTFRTALSDARIQSVDEQGVALSYKDYQDNDRWKTLKLKGEELIRRFLLHVMPKGLMRIRHYGFLANCCRKKKLAQIRDVLGQPQPAQQSGETANDPQGTGPREEQPDAWHCPHCKKGNLLVTESLAPVRLSSG